jgi:hypothetical protein
VLVLGQQPVAVVSGTYTEAMTSFSCSMPEAWLLNNSPLTQACMPDWATLLHRACRGTDSLRC